MNKHDFDGIGSSQYIVFKRSDTHYAIKTTGGENDPVTYSHTDFATLMNNLIAKVNSDGGGQIHIKGGSYDVNTSIIPKNNVHIEGEGKGITILKGTTSLANTMMLGSTTAFTSGSPLTNFVLSDMEFDGTNMDFASTYTQKRKAIDIAYIRRCFFYGLYIHDTPSTGLGVDFMDEVIIDRCIVDTCGFGGDGLATSGANGFGIGTGGRSAEPCIISNCIARNNRNGNFHYEVVGVTQANYSTFLNCYAEGGRYGYRITGTSSATISNCIATGASVADYAIVEVSGVSTDVTISNCKSISSAGTGIQCQYASAERLLINGCHVYDATGYGMELLNVGGVTVTNSVVSGCGKTGIYSEPSSGNTRTQYIISNNLIKNNGTAAVSSFNDGIRLKATGANFQHVSITDNIIVDDQGTPTQRYGLVVGGGTFTDVVIQGNIFQNNTTGAYLESSLTPVRYVVKDNVGLNPIGGSSITVSSSPFTYTAGTSPETVYIRGGTVSDISVGGRTLFAATGCTVNLPPKTAVVVTYTGAPTMEKYIH